MFGAIAASHAKRLSLLLVLLGGLLLAGRGLGSLGGFCGGHDLWRGQGLLGWLLRVGRQGGGAAGDVDVLAVVGDILGIVARSHGRRGFTHF